MAPPPRRALSLLFTLAVAACGASSSESPPRDRGTGGDGRPGTGGATSSTGGQASTGGVGGATGGAATGGAGPVGGARGGNTGTPGGAGAGARGGQIASGGSAGTVTGGAGGRGGANAGAGGASSTCPGAAYDAASPPLALTLTGNLGAHDPAAYVGNGVVYLAATGLVGKTSANLTAWAQTSNPLPLPSWAATSTGATNLWAPDISFFNGVYHLYYAASTFGSNKSCIGQATRASLEAGSWADQGMVLCSNMGRTDDWNAIDPNVIVDDAGTPWMALGSFWSGIKLVKLTQTGARADDVVVSLANGANGKGSLEGAWIFRRCGQYYLFTSWGSCCTSPYDYNIRVGRASVVTGPYLDKAGKSLMDGGGTLLVKGDSDWAAPGHNAVIAYGGKTYNLYHALKGGSTGVATLRIAELVWDDAGWPISGGP